MVGEYYEKDVNYICPRWQCGGLMSIVEEDDFQTPVLVCKNCKGVYALRPDHKGTSLFEQVKGILLDRLATLDDDGEYWGMDTTVNHAFEECCNLIVELVKREHFAMHEDIIIGDINERVIGHWCGCGHHMDEHGGDGVCKYCHDKERCVNGRR